MAARRQPAAAAAASPAGLKIKVKAGVAAGKASKEGHPHESGEDVGAEPGDGVVANARMLKRKRLTPPGSPASKRPPRGASPNSVTANGEPAESVPKRTGSNLADLNVVKQDVGKPGAVVGTTESVEPGADRVNDEETKVIAKAQGEIQVTSAATAEDQPGQKTDVDTLQAGDQSQSVATGVQVSSSLATSSVTTVADEVKHHTIPSHAGWFSWTEIHTLEKRGLPEFFSGKMPGKTPEIYLEYRNAIMKKYREHLGTVLTVADMQEHLSGVDEKAIYRIMEFLDHWGLINYQAPAEFLPSWKHPAPILVADAALMLRALPRKGSSLYHFDTTHAPVSQQSLVNPKTTDAVIAEMLAFGEGPEVEYHCNSCGADCSKQRYHCQKQADFDLCPDCYNEEHYGPDMASTDFIKMDVTEASNANGGGWTDQETLLLLEALELYGDNWNEIAEHVATKSKSQCILHFIRLPVEDPFSEEADGLASTSNAPVTTPVSQTDSTLEGEQEEKETAEKEPGDDAANIPSTDTEAEPWSEELVMPSNLATFAEAGNPVMAQMSFLATMIGSNLGSEAAQAALAALTTKDPGVHLAAGTAMILEDAVADVERSSSENPGRSVQVDEEMLSADETTATDDAGPSPSGGVKIPVSDSTASAQNDEDAPSQSEPNLGKEVVQKTDVAESLDVMKEAKGAGRVKRAAASAMAAAAVKAKLLADQEEREMQRLIGVVIDHQLKKLDLKLKFLNELEAAIGKECDQVERDRSNFFTEHARIAASHLGGSSNFNPPPSPPRQQAIVPVQPQAPASFQGQIYGHGFQAMPGVSSNHQMSGVSPNHAAFMQSQMYQGLANSMNAGAMTMQQSHFGRQMMMQAGASPHMLGRQEMITPPSQVLLGRPMMGSENPGGALPGMSRPVPGGALGGMPQ